MPIRRVGTFGGTGNAVRVGDLSVGEVIKHRWEEPGNRFLKFLDALAIGQQAIAGIAKEEVRRIEGKPGRNVSVAQAALRGIAERETFVNVLGGPRIARLPAGIALDVLFDLVTYIPVGAIPETAAKLARATRIAKYADKIMKIPQVELITDKVGSRLARNYFLRKGNYQEILDAKNELYGAMHELKNTRMGEFEEALNVLIPDESRRRGLGILWGTEPLDPHSPAHVVWQERFNEFVARGQKHKNIYDEEPGAVKEIWDFAKQSKKEIEDVKQSLGWVDDARMNGLLEKMGVANHFTRRNLTKSQTMRAIREQIAALEKSKESLSPKLIADVTAKQEALRYELDLMEMVPETLGPIRRQKIQAYPKAELPSFMYERKDLRSLDELAKEELGLLELDLGKIFTMEQKELSIAKAKQKYVLDAGKWLHDNGMMMARQMEGKTLGQIAESLGRTVEELDPRVVEAIKKGEMVPLRVKQFQDFLAPKAVADDINKILESYSNPKAVEEAFSLWVKATSWWKAWTLVVFPAYHSRNFISNIWNNYLAGMGLDTYQDYQVSHLLLHRFRTGQFNDGIIEGLGKTDRELFKESLRNRIISGGETAGEMAGAMDDMMTRNWFLRLANPETNRAIGVGYKFGRNIEDHARLAHYIWRLRKGDSSIDASKSVMKYLFDYQYGLSDFESKWFRNRLLPFYAWTRFNLPLQFEMLINKPQKFMLARKATRGLETQYGGPDPNELFFAEWLKTAPKVRFMYDKDTGTYRYFMVGGFWPATDIGKVLSLTEAGKELLNLVTPFIKNPVEFIANYDMFRFEKIEKFKGEKKKLLGIPLPARIEHAARSVRVANEADRVLQAGSARYSDEPLGRLINAGLRLFFGKPYPVKSADQKRRWDFDTRKRLGLLNSLERRYKRDGDYRNVEAVRNEIKNLEQLRRHLGLR